MLMANLWCCLNYLDCFAQTTFISDLIPQPLYYFVRNQRLLRSKLKQIISKQERLNNLSLLLLKIVGTGYKSIVPKKFNRRVLFLRVGFAASELKYSLLNPNIKIRARKQKIALFWI